MKRLCIVEVIRGFPYGDIEEPGPTKRPEENGERFHSRSKVKCAGEISLRSTNEDFSGDIAVPMSNTR
jgi:hypothetical protein